MNLNRFLFLFLIAFFSFCHTKEKEVFRAEHGFYYRLISFSEENKQSPEGKLLHVRASFQTQRDSVFWDSYNNLKDLFVLKADSLDPGILIRQLSRHVVGDSFCLAIPVPDFMQEVYHTSDTPYFLKNDSAVKIYLKLVGMFEDDYFLPGRSELETAEYRQIEAFLGGPEATEKARDANGFFWIEKPDPSASLIVPGTSVQVSLKGSFLSGRVFDRTPIQHGFIYGNPDQVLPGINYVIARLGQGQTAKIILPSRLAFGEFGSSNGAVPPFTPLIYEISTGT